uniref:Uncharacterized protein n=1 Tax=Glossina pallidipes TaxID=7398 RepID=A0A1A9ZYW0_GLOPL
MSPYHGKKIAAELKCILEFLINYAQLDYGQYVKVCCSYCAAHWDLISVLYEPKMFLRRFFSSFAEPLNQPSYLIDVTIFSETSMRNVVPSLLPHVTNLPLSLVRKQYNGSSQTLTVKTGSFCCCNKSQVSSTPSIRVMKN